MNHKECPTSPLGSGNLTRISMCSVLITKEVHSDSRHAGQHIMCIVNTLLVVSPLYQAPYKFDFGRSVHVDRFNAGLGVSSPRSTF